MKKITVFLFVFFIVTITHAQYKVKFILKEQTPIHHDSIYITGTFSHWDSTANKNFLLQPYGKNEKSIVLDVKAGAIRYKFHRGSWLTVEKNYNGNEVPDRVIIIRNDTSLTDSIISWRDLVLADKKYALAQQNTDTARVHIMAAIANVYAFSGEYYKPDSALFYVQRALEIQQKIMASEDHKSLVAKGNTEQLITLQEIIASLLHALGNYPKALEIRFENLKLAEKEKDKVLMAYTIDKITSDYISMKDYQNSLRYGKLLDSIVNTMAVNDRDFYYFQSSAKGIIAGAFYHQGLVDSALYYALKKAAIKTGFEDGDVAFTSSLLGDIYAKKGNDSAAFTQYRITYQTAYIIYNPQLASKAAAGMARLFQKQGRTDSALQYARQAIDLLRNYKNSVQSWGENADSYTAEITPLLAELYKANNQPDSAYKYLLLSITLKDSLYNSDKVRQFQTLTFNESSRRQQLEQQSMEAQKEYETKIKMYGLISIIAGVLIVAFILYRNNKHKQKANTLLQSQKEEIEKTLGELKTTQTQLIQSEKMASLGELTAGIAHEIQNPLNFVNNFSEVNTELIDEAGQEIDKGNINEAKIILNDIRENEQKINHHGKRADAIVKGMLQHSRSSSGVKEPTDINALCDEYLRLSYHGLRAKDKSFNATMKTDYDTSLEKINIIPENIGRVVLNLLTNAFYAVDEKKKAGIEGYEPIVTVSTSRSPLLGRGVGGEVKIIVTDNGNGIPPKVLDKIFQPFFTTKPTGQGTGLGLSLSYDIIKAHGGELKVETKENEGSEFSIQLPVN